MSSLSFLPDLNHPNVIIPKLLKKLQTYFDLNPNLLSRVFFFFIEDFLQITRSLVTFLFTFIPTIALLTITVAAPHLQTIAKWTLWKWGHFDNAKLTLKMLQASWNFDTLYNRLRSFIARNLGSVGQRALKLPAIKLLEWFDPGCLKSGPTGSTFSLDLLLWHLVTLKPFDLQNSY